MNRIDSASNPFFKKIRSLLESKGIKKEGLFFVFGKKPIEETLQSSHRESRFILANQDLADEAHRLNRFLPKGGETLFLANPLFEELNIFGISYPLLICESPKWSEWKQEDVPTLICPFQNPQNLGAALRSALAFDFKVVLTKESAHPLHPRCMRALSGNIFNHNLQFTNSIHDIPPSDRLIVVDQGGQEISKAKWPRNAILLVGEEGQGVPNSFNHSPKVSVAISKRQESLNAMAALTIATYEYRKHHPL